MKENTITLAAVVSASPRLLKGVTLADVRYFMDIAEKEKEWAVACHLKDIIEAQEARLKEAAKKEAARKAAVATQTVFKDGMGGYISFLEGGELEYGVDYTQDLPGLGEWEVVHASRRTSLIAADWRRFLQAAREASLARNHAASRRVFGDVLETVTGERDMWFSPEEYQYSSFYDEEEDWVSEY